MTDLVEQEESFAASGEARVVVLACGAIAREVLAVRALHGWGHVDVRCLPAKLHSTPARIPAAVDARLEELKQRYEAVFVAYADCGTAGALDEVLDRHGVERLEGAHCYGFFAGNAAWDALQEDEPATFYLTDFLARHFDALVWRGLGLDRYPELLPQMFGNYRRLVFLAQTDDENLTARAVEAAERLGLVFERRRTGYGELRPALERFVARVPLGTGLPLDPGRPLDTGRPLDPGRALDTGRASPAPTGLVGDGGATSAAVTPPVGEGLAPPAPGLAPPALGPMLPAPGLAPPAAFARRAACAPASSVSPPERPAGVAR